MVPKTQHLDLWVPSSIGLTLVLFCSSAFSRSSTPLRLPFLVYGLEKDKRISAPEPPPLLSELRYALLLTYTNKEAGKDEVEGGKLEGRTLGTLAHIHIPHYRTTPCLFVVAGKKSRRLNSSRNKDKPSISSSSEIKGGRSRVAESYLLADQQIVSSQET